MTKAFVPRSSRPLAGTMFAAALAAAGAAQGQTAGEAERLLNPLSSLEASKLTGFGEKPLFTPSRTPPRIEEEPEEPVEVVEEPVEAQPPNVRLVGVLQMSGASVAMLEDLGDKSTSSVRLGDALGEWEVAAIEPARVLLKSGEAEHEFKLFQLGTAAGAALASKSDDQDAEAESLDPEYEGQDEDEDEDSTSLDDAMAESGSAVSQPAKAERRHSARRTPLR